MQEESVIAVKDLRKNYGSVVAVDGVSFQVQAGEIFGMVGPNGSGKTTTIECIEGLRRQDAGSVHVMGLEPNRDNFALRERIGIQLQASSLPNRMRVQEALDLFASFYPEPTDWTSLLERLGLVDKRRAFFSQLSGGQKQRLFVALALINNPEIVFLDELTTGLDPQARHAIWDLVRQIREQGTTVFLTTHFMEEAERLCDRVAILDHGRIIALDTPANLVNQLATSTRIIFYVNGRLSSTRDGTQVRSQGISFNSVQIVAIDGVQRVEQDGDKVIVCGKGEGWVGAVIKTLEAASVPFQNLHIEQANLEDVFLALTGRGIKD